jgi:hypothetical protein
MAYDLNKIIAEYGQDDFGFSTDFSTVSEEEYSTKIAEQVKEEDSVITSQKMQELEKLILPFFTKLLKTADKEYIYWPNRTSAVEAQIQKILQITRG